MDIFITLSAPVKYLKMKRLQNSIQILWLCWSTSQLSLEISLHNYLSLIMFVFQANIKLFRNRSGGFKPYVLNMKTDGCKLISDRNMNFPAVFKMIRHIVKEHSNLNNSCPLHVVSILLGIIWRVLNKKILVYEVLCNCFLVVEKIINHTVQLLSTSELRI